MGAKATGWKALMVGHFSVGRPANPKREWVAEPRADCLVDRLPSLEPGGSLYRVSSPIAIVSFPGSEADSLPHEIRAAIPVSDTAELTAAMANGDEAAFARFFELYFNRLLRYLLVVSRGDEVAARDALQDTMTRVAKHVRRFEEDQVLWDWLTVLARSAARDAGRKQTRYRNLLARFFEKLPPDLAPSGDSQSEDLMNSALEAALVAIGEEDRGLIEAKYFEGASVRELSRARQVTEKSVESRLLRIRRRLRDEMNKQLSDER
jgi:RNA polymerase sigma-70 factor (ECF subfamily)